MRPKSLVLILFILFCFKGINSQESKVMIQGVVVDSNHKPVINAFIMIDNENTGLVTNFRGKFKIKVPADAKKIAVVSLKDGMIEEEIAGRSRIDFSYKPNITPDIEITEVPPGEDNINTGYNYVKRRDLLSRIDKKDVTDKKYAGYRSVSDILREFGGVQVYGSKIVIQDSKNFSGHVYALVVVDGVYIDNVDLLKPAEVESIQVLKGASAAIYGTRGFGGAVVITTKKANN